MIEFAWSGGDLFYRERSFQVDAAGAFCGVTEFGEWKKVPTLHEFPPQEISDSPSVGLRPHKDSVDKLAKILKSGEGEFSILDS